MRGLRVWFFLAFCLAGFAAAGCGKEDLSNPPKIQYGRDGCAQCRMILGDERFACAAVSADKRFLKFDDIGCLAAYENDPSGRGLRSWVRDAGAGEWIEKERAHFIYSRDLVTPMGYGFAAFANLEDAAKFAQEKTGRVIMWTELLELTKKQVNLKGENAQ